MKYSSITFIIVLSLAAGSAMGQNMPNLTGNIPPVGTIPDSQIRNLLSEISVTRNSDFVLRIPLSLNKLNWRVSKVVVYGVLSSDQNLHPSDAELIGMGTDTIDVSSSHSINRTVDVPVYLKPEAVKNGSQARHYFVEISLIDKAGNWKIAGNSQDLPYWARVNTNGQNDLANYNHTPGNEKYVGIDGEVSE